MKHAGHRHLAGLLLGLACAQAAIAGVHQHAEQGALAGNVSRELMERAGDPTMPCGALHQPVTTASPEAQARYDQGISCLASFVWIEAARAFHQALRDDPDLAMAHVGLARAYFATEAVDEARHHLARAKEIAERIAVTRKEATWIALARQQLDAVTAPASEKAGRHVAYKRSLDQLVALDPRDPFAWLLRGNAEEPGAWGRGQAALPTSVKYYQRALQQDPDNFAAHHFLAHAYENMGAHESAVEHARVYATAAPAVPHAHHMYAHVLPRVGRWREAREQLVAADRLERSYSRSLGIAAEEDWHHGHNLHLLGVVTQRLGDASAAEVLLHEAYGLRTRGILADRYSAPWIELLLLQERFDEALESALAVEHRNTPLGSVVGPALAGEALLARGRIDDARQALSRAQAALPAAIRAATGSAYETFPAYFLQPYLDVLSIELALRADDPARAELAYVAMAEAVVANPHLDAWAEGLFRIERLAADARRAQRPTLSRALNEKLERIAPRDTKP